MPLTIRFTHVHERHPEVVLGPFDAVEISYGEVMVGGIEAAIAHMTQSGTWEIQMFGKTLKRFGTQYDGLEYTDIAIEAS